MEKRLFGEINMIIVKGIKGDKICVNATEEINVVDLSVVGFDCQVVGCRGDHLWGYNFCREHTYLLPTSSDKTPHGFQVSFIEYWESQGKKVFHTHTYIGQKLSKTFLIQQKIRKIKKRLEDL